MIDDLTLIALGRQLIEFTTQREQLIRANQQLQERIGALEKAAKPREEVDGS